MRILFSYILVAKIYGLNIYIVFSHESYVEFYIQKLCKIVIVIWEKIPDIT